MISQNKQMAFNRICSRAAGLILAALVILLMKPVAGFAQAGGSTMTTLQVPPFSADQIHIVKGKTQTLKVHATSNAMRMEGEQKGKPTITIARFDRKVMWSLMPEQKMYVELPWANMGEWATYVQGAEVQRQQLGDDQVGAYHCEKSRVQVRLQGKTYTSLEWRAKELNGFVVKTADEKGQWSNEYQNIQLGPQDASLFELPPDYKKLSIGGLGGLFQK